MQLVTLVIEVLDDFTGAYGVGMTRSGRVTRREVTVRLTGVTLRIAMVGLAASVLAGLPPLAAAQARPRNPSDGEIAAAQQARARKASDVGRLTGLGALADGDMTRATDQAELAGERYHKAQLDLATAARRARHARAR